MGWERCKSKLTEHGCVRTVWRPAKVRGSILRMLEHYLGADTFRDGLRRYIIKHQYANARTHDLWNALGEASGEPVAEIMDTWVAQTGYPVIDVKVHRQEDGIDLALTQTKFAYEHILGEKSADQTVWRVPVSARTASDAQPVSVLMEDVEAEARVHPAPYGSISEWIKINPMQTGFYRVRYPDDELALLRAPISNRVLPPADRLGHPAVELLRSLFGFELFLGLADRPDDLVLDFDRSQVDLLGPLDPLEHQRLRHLVGAGFHHDDPVSGACNNNVHRARL